MMSYLSTLEATLIANVSNSYLTLVASLTSPSTTVSLFLALSVTHFRYEETFVILRTFRSVLGLGMLRVRVRLSKDTTRLKQNFYITTTVKITEI